MLAIELFAIEGIKIGTAIKQWTKMADDSTESMRYRVRIGYWAWKMDVIIEDEVPSEH